jgi:hypothetical protein
LIDLPVMLDDIILLFYHFWFSTLDVANIQIITLLSYVSEGLLPQDNSIFKLTVIVLFGLNVSGEV